MAATELKEHTDLGTAALRHCGAPPHLIDDCYLTYCMNVHLGGSGGSAARHCQRGVRSLPRYFWPPFGLGSRLGCRAAALPRPLQISPTARAALPSTPFHTVPSTTGGQDQRLPAGLVAARAADYTPAGGRPLAALEGVEAASAPCPLPTGPLLPTPQLPRLRATGRCRPASAGTGTPHGKVDPSRYRARPDCLIENTQECISFFEKTPPPLGTAWICCNGGLTRQQAEGCFTATSARPDIAIWRSLRSRPAGASCLHRHHIRLSDQLSGAETDPQRLSTRSSPCRDHVYPHQVKIRQPDGTLSARNDLPRPPGLPAPRRFAAISMCWLDFATANCLDQRAADHRFYHGTALRRAPFEIETYTSPCCHRAAQSHAGRTSSPSTARCWGSGK